MRGGDEARTRCEGKRPARDRRDDMHAGRADYLFSAATLSEQESLSLRRCCRLPFAGPVGGVI